MNKVQLFVPGSPVNRKYWKLPSCGMVIATEGYEGVPKEEDDGKIEAFVEIDEAEFLRNPKRTYSEIVL